MVSVHFLGKPLNIGVIQFCAPSTNAEEAEVEWLKKLKLKRTKNVIFIIGNQNTKVGSQEIPGVTGKFDVRVQNEAGQKLTVLPRKYTGHSKHPLPTTQEITLQIDITIWSILKSD